jgi:Type II secretion system (T2SS), protein M subtype b
VASLLHSVTRMAASSSRSATTHKHARLQTALGVLLLLNAVLAFFLFRSPGLTASERHKEVARLESAQRTAESRVQHLMELKKKVQDATNNEQKFSQANFLSRSSAFSAMLTNLEQLASANHLQPTSATYHLDQGDNKLGWTDVELSFEVDGDYPNLVRFLNQLEQSKLFWIIESLDVSGQQGSKVRLNLQAATYLLPS